MIAQVINPKVSLNMIFRAVLCSLILGNIAFGIDPKEKPRRPGTTMIERDPFEEIERKEGLGEDSREVDDSSLDKDAQGIKRCLVNAITAFNRQDADLYSSLYVSDMRDSTRIQYGTFFIENDFSIKLWEHFIVDKSERNAEVMVSYDILPTRWTVVSTVKLEKEDGKWLMRSETIKSRKTSTVPLTAFSPKDHPPVKCSGGQCAVQQAVAPIQQPMGACPNGRCNIRVTIR